MEHYRRNQDIFWCFRCVIEQWTLTVIKLLKFFCINVDNTHRTLSVTYWGEYNNVPLVVTTRSEQQSSNNVTDHNKKRSSR